ncbi:hypothetical protein GCM10009745_35430 [Kribbella yunnanensis]|uniref:PASTA domain-containing protein n=1 Tax=Kribbella yunnanensis TaxID=190194 RepID=A0ABP4TG76_9ACTN
MTNSLDLLRSLDPVATADPAEQVTPESRADLLRGITATPMALKSHSPVRRRLVPVLAVAAAVAVVTTLIVRVPDGNDRQEAMGSALSFTTEGDVMRVRVLDPAADVARYNEEFKQHGLNITLHLQPVSPSIVGQSIAMSGSADSAQIIPGRYPKGCKGTPASPCVPEFTIPLSFRGQADLYVGRTAKPGEAYSGAGDIDAPGEALEGVEYKGRTVAYLLGKLTERGMTAEYRVGKKSEQSDSAPPSWVVEDAIPSSDRHVILFVTP